MCEHYTCVPFPAKDVVRKIEQRQVPYGSPGEGCCHLRAWCSPSEGAVHSGQGVTAPPTRS